MLRVEGIAKYFNGRVILKGASFALEEGTIAGLVGPSGGGKTVLLKILAGVLDADAGRLSAESFADWRELSVGFSFQEGALFDSMNVIDNVSFPLMNSGRKMERFESRPSVSEASQRAYEILNEVGLAKHILKMPGQLSGGMRRRVGIARALVGRPRLVLLDDPTGGLDPVAASVIIDLVKKLHEHYRPTIIMVSHDLRRLLPNVARVLGLFEGRIVVNEPPSELPGCVTPEVLRFLETRFDFGAYLGRQA